MTVKTTTGKAIIITAPAIAAGSFALNEVLVFYHRRMTICVVGRLIFIFKFKLMRYVCIGTIKTHYPINKKKPCLARYLGMLALPAQLPLPTRLWLI
jgi:hypothetical protein